MAEFYFIAGLFLGVASGSILVLGYQYIVSLQNTIFELQSALNVERCAKWHNVEHRSQVRRRNLRDKAQESIELY